MGWTYPYRPKPLTANVTLKDHFMHNRWLPPNVTFGTSLSEPSGVFYICMKKNSESGQLLKLWIVQGIMYSYLCMALGEFHDGNSGLKTWSNPYKMCVEIFLKFHHPPSGVHPYIKSPYVAMQCSNTPLPTTHLLFKS